MPSIEEIRAGTYAEPFEHIQFGVFIANENNEPIFVAAAFGRDDALRQAEHIYKTDEVAKFFVRTRTVTYSPWD